LRTTPVLLRIANERMGLPSLPCTYKNQQVEVPDVCDKRSKSPHRGGFLQIMSPAIMRLGCVPMQMKTTHAIA